MEVVTAFFCSPDIEKRVTIAPPCVHGSGRRVLNTSVEAEGEVLGGYTRIWAMTLPSWLRWEVVSGETAPSNRIREIV
ncbi:hypothetical protein [Rothia uropygialis]|uniref:hypothetical protein n=1 Tax=Kocuria sp. 36 TaxID=1415402 RepID=UPI00101B8E49|nr:hypothetical protein [Kocuria sp. 36]